MSYRCSHAGYKVQVDGVFLARTRFVIHAVVNYEADLSTVERERLTPKAQLELLLAIYGESQRGRHHGARTVHVAVEGDRKLDGLFKLRTFPPSQAPPNRSHAMREVDTSLAEVKDLPLAESVS